MTASSTLAQNLASVRTRIARAERAAGREPGSVELVAVTKTVDAQTAFELCELGLRDLGENRADALEKKHAHFLERGVQARWHFVGHVQRNKLRRVVALADVIHSVDSIELLESLDREAARAEKLLDLYLQLKLTDESTKSGLDPALAIAFVERARRATNARLVGLMAMAPLPSGDPVRDADERSRAFAGCARIAREMAARPEHRVAFADGRVRLSMGMSDDFETAIAAGSDCVRIGSFLFEGVADARGREPREAQ